MKTQWMYFALFWLLVALAGCGDDSAVEQALRDAESCMMQRPDSALMLLTDIDGSAIYDDELRARHALLLSQAMDKNYIDETSDSLINIAVEHYSSADDPMRRFLSLYYQGRVYYNANNFTRSILSYTQAEQLIDQFDNPHAVGLLYAQFGLIYNNTYDFVKSLDAYDKSYKYYEQAGSEAHQYYAIKDIGQTLFHLKEYDSAEEYLLKAMNWMYDAGYYTECQNCYIYLIRNYEVAGELQKIDEMFNSKFYEICTENVSILEAIAYHHALKGDVISAEKSLNKAWQQSININDTFDIYSLTYSIYRINKNYEKAVINYEKAVQIQDSIVKQTLQQPLSTAQRDFYHAKAELSEYKLQTNRQLLLCIVVIAFLVISSIAFYLRHRIIKSKAEKMEAIEAIRMLNVELSEKNRQICDLSGFIDENTNKKDEFTEKIYNLFSRQFQFFDKMGSTYYEAKNDVPDIEIIYKHVKNGIDSFSKENYSELEAYVNQYKENVMARLRSEINLKEDDYRLLCYCFAGFSAKTISVFTEISITNIYSRKSRLKSMLSKENPKSIEIIMSYLD